MIGVEVYEIFIGAVMFLDIGEECSECTVEIAHSLPTGLFTERRRAQVGTRLAALRAGEPFRKRETSLYTRCDLIEWIGPRVLICRVQKDKLIRITQPLQMADHTLDALVCELAISCDDEAVIPARCAVVDPDPIAHKIRRRVTCHMHTFGECYIVRME